MQLADTDTDAVDAVPLPSATPKFSPDDRRRGDAPRAKATDILGLTVLTNGFFGAGGRGLRTDTITEVTL